MKYKGILALIIFLVTVTGCSLIDKIIDEYDPTPAPTATPVPTNTPEPEPTPTPSDPMWGYVRGQARVLVENLPYEPTMDKGSIFHLYHPTTGAWLNIRHRVGNMYQPKGALNSEYACHAEINYYDMQPAGNGIWTIEWGEYQSCETWVEITAPGSEPVKLWFYGGVAAWREIRPGSGDARIPHGAGADVSVLEIGGTVGLAVECAE